MKSKQELDAVCKKEYWARKTVEELRLKLYAIEDSVKELSLLIEALWSHHQDGSELMVNKNELFNITNNEFPIIVRYINYKIRQAKEKIVELKKSDPEEEQVK